jgi:hypothetical protein
MRELVSIGKRSGYRLSNCYLQSCFQYLVALQAWHGKGFVPMLQLAPFLSHCAMSLGSIECRGQNCALPQKYQNNLTANFTNLIGISSLQESRLIPKQRKLRLAVIKEAMKSS